MTNSVRQPFGSFLQRIAGGVVFCLVFPNIVATHVGAADLPIGIPAPSFGLEETIESVYGSGTFYTHWIDNTHPGATDSSNPNGSPTRPRLTIPTVSSLPAGSVVQLRGGPYTGGTLTLGGRGTAEAPIIFRGASPANKVRFQRGIRVRDCSYLIIENIAWSSVGNALLELRSEATDEEVAYVAVRDCDGAGLGYRTGGTAFVAAGTIERPAHHIVYARNTLHDFGNWQQETENDCHALGVGGRNHHVWYLWNTAYHNGGDGIGNGHDANHTTSDLYMGGNILYENRENAIDLKEVHNVVISENTCYGYEPTSSSEGAAIVIHYGPTTGEGPYNVWIIKNTIFDSRTGIVSSEVGDSWWMGNVIYNCNTALSPDRGGGNVRLIGNTVYNCANGISSTGTMDRLEIRSNILANISEYHLRVTSPSVRSTSVTSNNLFYNSSGSVSIQWGSTYSSVSAWNSDTGAAPASLQSDPRFVNAASNAFELGTGSPAIGSGYALTTFETVFKSSFAASLLQSVSVAPVDTLTTWNIGARPAATSGVPTGPGPLTVTPATE